jgi:hypothetical protein
MSPKAMYFADRASTIATASTDFFITIFGLT